MELPQPLPPDVPKGNPGVFKLICIAWPKLWKREGLARTFTDWTNPFARIEYVDDMVLYRLRKYPFPDANKDGNNWFLAKVYAYRYWRKDGSTGTAGALISIPPGTYTDLSTVPRPVRWLISVSGRHTEASVVHDYCYQDHAGSGLDRFNSDWLFYVGMRDAKVSRLRRWSAYLAVRFCGWIAYYTGRDD